MQQLQVCLGSMCVLPLSKTGEEFEGYSTTFWEPIKSWYSFGPIVVSTMTLTCFEAVKNFGEGKLVFYETDMCCSPSTVSWMSGLLKIWTCQGSLLYLQGRETNKFLFRQILFLQFAHFSISDTVCCGRSVTMSVFFWFLIKIRDNRTYPVDICVD